MFPSLLFVVVVHAAGGDKQDNVMRGNLWDKLHGRPSQLLFARPAVIDPVAKCWLRIVVFAYHIGI